MRSATQNTASIVFKKYLLKSYFKKWFATTETTPHNAEKPKAAHLREFFASTLKSWRTPSLSFTSRSSVLISVNSSLISVKRRSVSLTRCSNSFSIWSENRIDQPSQSLNPCLQSRRIIAAQLVDRMRGWSVSSFYLSYLFLDAQPLPAWKRMSCRAWPRSLISTRLTEGLTCSQSAVDIRREQRPGNSV